MGDESPLRGSTRLLSDLHIRSNARAACGGRLCPCAGKTSPHFRRLACELLEDRRVLSISSPTIELFDAMPALFVENQGQLADESVRYGFFGSGANVLHTDSGPVFQLFQREAVEETGKADHLNGPPGLFVEPEEVITQHTQFSVRFDGADTVEPVGLDQAETVHNYFLGDQANWRTGVPTYETVAYPALYDGIDLFTWGRRDSLKYEFHVAPGADYGQIQVSYNGIDRLWLDDKGVLHLETTLGELIDDAPYVYQEIAGEQIEVTGSFELVDSDTYSFHIVGKYDPGLELIIDPTLAWSTFLGGSSDDHGMDIAVDGFGNAIVAGWTESPGWVSDGFDTSRGGSKDAFVAKLSPTGGHVWSTYLGGSSWDQGYGIAVDGAGNAIVAGLTRSSGWASGGFDTSHNGGLYDAFVAKLSPTGGHLWSTYLGGSSWDDGFDIAVDGSGNAMVTGYTDSAGWVSGGSDTSYNVSGDAFVVKLSPTGSHLWSTYLGGGYSDEGRGIAVDGSGNALVTGRTLSSGWASGGFDTIHNGELDTFVAKLSPTGDHLWSTYLGGSSDDFGWGIAADGFGNAIVTGWTESVGWVSGGFDTSRGGSKDAFVAKLSPTGEHIWSTYLGGDGSGGTGYGIAVDSTGNVLVTGMTFSPGWVSGGFDSSHNGSADAFVAKLSATGSHLWSAYLGGGSGDWGSAIAVDGSGNALVTGSTYPSSWASGGFDTSHN